MNDLTADTFLNGRIRVRQNRSGYRFSIDAVLLAHHIMPREGDTVLDLGTGCGIIPLIIAICHPNVRIYGVEIQKGLADIAALNVKENQMDDRITILCRDMKTLTCENISGPVNLAVSNPPYRKADSGRVNPNNERAIARHEISATLSDVIETARRMLSASGKLITVYPAERMADLLTYKRSAGIEPKFIRMIHSGQNTEAKLFLSEGIKGARPGMKVGPPLVIYSENGDYSDEVKQMMEVRSEEEVRSEN